MEHLKTFNTFGDCQNLEGLFENWSKKTKDRASITRVLYSQSTSSSGSTACTMLVFYKEKTEESQDEKATRIAGRIVDVLLEEGDLL